MRCPAYASISSCASAALVLACCLGLAGCGRLMALRKPPRAWLMPAELPRWTCTPAACTASGVLLNIGNGCATQIAGVVVLLDTAGRPVHSSAFAFPPQQIVDPRERVDWRIDFVAPAAAAAAARLVVVPSWVSTPCNVGGGWFGK